jgi:HEAT repeat protein
MIGTVRRVLWIADARCTNRDAVLAFLLKGLHARDERIQLLFALALGQCGDPRAATPLARHPSSSTTPHDDVEALAKLDDPKALDILARILSGRERLAAGDSERRHAQVAAAAALGTSRDPGVMVPLLEGLGSKEWRVREAAAKALGVRRNGDAVEALSRLLTSDSGENESAVLW